MKTAEIIARAICGAEGLYDPVAFGGHSWGLVNWKFHSKEAGAVEPRLSAAGMVIVPREPTERMLEHAGVMEVHDRYDDKESDRCHIEWWQAMLRAWEQENETGI